MAKEISNITIKCFDPGVDTEPHYKRFEVPHDENATVLDCLNYIYEFLDPSVSFRYACKIGFCVSCQIVVNGKACFSCLMIAEKEMTIEPHVKKLHLLKDLATDISDA